MHRSLLLLGMFPKIIQLSLIVLLGIIIGGLFFLVNPLLLLVAISGLLVLIIISYLKPEIGILTTAVLISSIVFEYELPLIPLPFGAFHISDIILLSLLVSILIKSYFTDNFKFHSTPLDRPLVLFYLAAVLSIYTSIAEYGVDFRTAMKFLRPTTYYLIFFAITNLIQGKKQIKFLIKGLSIIAIVVGISMIVQAIIGSSVRLVPGRVEGAKVFEQAYEATRIIPPGSIVLYLGLIISICTIVLINKPLFKSTYIYSTPILIGGIILTYFRMYWVTIIFLLSIFIILISKRNKMKFMAWFSTILIVLSILSLAFLSLGGRPRAYVNSISARFSSLFSGEKIYGSDTLEFRRRENSYALAQIAKHPLIGIGLATDYRPFDPFLSAGPLWFMHNGYLWILMKTGFIGFLPFCWFYLRFIKRSYSNWKKVKDLVLRSALVGFMLAAVGLLLINIIDPMFMLWPQIVVISIMIGLGEAIIKIKNPDEEKLSGLS